MATTPISLALALAVAACGGHSAAPDAAQCTAFNVTLPFAIAPTLTWVGNGWGAVAATPNGTAYIRVASDGSIAANTSIAGLQVGKQPGQLVWDGQRVRTVLVSPTSLATATSQG